MTIDHKAVPAGKNITYTYEKYGSTLLFHNIVRMDAIKQ